MEGRERTESIREEKTRGETRGGGDGGVDEGTTDGWDQTEHGEQVCVSWLHCVFVFQGESADKDGESGRESQCMVVYLDPIV